MAKVEEVGVAVNWDRVEQAQLGEIQCNLLFVGTGKANEVVDHFSHSHRGQSHVRPLQ